MQKMKERGLRWKRRECEQQCELKMWCMIVQGRTPHPQGYYNPYNNMQGHTPPPPFMGRHNGVSNSHNTYDY